MKPREMSELLKRQRFGVEIEMYGITRERASVVASEFFGGTFKNTEIEDGYRTWSAFEPNGRKWKFSRDSSIIPTGGSYGGDDNERCEMVTPILTYDDLDKLCELVRVLRKNGAKSDPAHMCGVHIHVDGHRHTGKSLRNLVRIMYSHEDQIAQALNMDPSRENSYCGKIDIDFLEEVNKLSKPAKWQIEEAWYDGRGGRDTHYHRSRYRMLNLHSFFYGHGTVEFRCFQFQNPDPEISCFDGNTQKPKRNGLHAGQLKAMVQMALAINNVALVSKSSRCNKTEKTNATDSFKGWMYRIGFVGEEFKTAKQYWSRQTTRTLAETRLAA